MIQPITDAEFAQKVASGMTVVDFYASWCGPCKMISPALEEISNELPEIKFLKIDIDENGETPTSLGVRALPTLLFLKDGKEVDEGRLVGAASKSDIKKWIEARAKQ